MEQLLGDLLDPREPDPLTLLDGERVVRGLELDERPRVAATDEGSDPQLAANELIEGQTHRRISVAETEIERYTYARCVSTYRK